MTPAGRFLNKSNLFILKTVFVFLLCSDAIVAQDRIQKWSEDLDTLVFSFLPKDQSFSPGARERFQNSIKRLRNQLGEISDQQIIVNIASAAAFSQNAHTRLYLIRNRSSARRYPIRVYWFGNALHVLKAKPECSELSGSKVIAINGRPIERLKEKVSSLYAGNLSWQNYMSTYLLTSPDILIGLGVVQESGHGELLIPKS